MYDARYEFIGWDALIQTWLPKGLGALLILVGAWAIGTAIKWALAKGVDRIPGAAKANLSENPKHSIGHSLGDVAFWLILLFGVVAALGVLGLGQVVTPLNTLLNQVASFLPNILGAALIFFIGYIVATLARRVTEAALKAASADAWLERAGLSRATGSTGVSSAVGTLVFVLVLIPITIAALEQLSIESLTIPAVAVLATVFDAIPRVLAIGWFIGRWVAQVIERVLPATGFDRSISGFVSLSSARPEGASAEAPAPYAGDVTPATARAMGDRTVARPMTPSRIVGLLAMVAIVAFTAIEAARLLEFGAVATLVEEVLSLAVRIITGGIIIVAGVILGDVLSNAINRGTDGADRFASTIVRWATIALATAMGLSFMGIADEIVMLAFGLVLGAAAVAAALAFGLGGRGAAGQVAQSWADKLTKASKSTTRPRS